MKRSVLLLGFALAVMSVFGSCSKEYTANVDAFNSDVAGRYTFNTSIWEGDGGEIALWEDRVSNNKTSDISEQLHDFDCVKQLIKSFGGYVDPIGESKTGRIYLKFPLQGIKYGENDSYEITDPVTAGITFIYEVNDAGQIEILPTVDYSEVSILKDYGYFTHVDNAKITQLSQGVIRVELSMGFYDYNHSAIVYGPVALTYYNDKSGR